MTLTAAGLFFCGAGGGRVSLDRAFGLDGFGWPTALGCAAVGLGGALGLLVGFWRPDKPVPTPAVGT
jgi:putative oxidoreductase